MNNKITNNIVDVLVRLDNEAKTFKPSDNEAKTFKPLNKEYIVRLCAIQNILEKVSEDFGENYMIYVFALTCKKLGHTLGPLHSKTVKKLISKGFKIENVGHIISLK